MKKRFSKQSALLFLGLALIGMSLACYMWVRREQRQYALDRQLIAALLKSDTKQAWVLVEKGADSNTKEIPAPAPTLTSLVEQFLHPSPLQANSSSTAFLIACGVKFADPLEPRLPMEYEYPPLDPQLTNAMLFHGANVNAKDHIGWTALHYRAFIVPYSMNTQYNMNKKIIKLLLDYGADPDEEDKAYRGMFGRTPMKSALDAVSLKANAHPDLIALLRKYRKHT